MKNVLKAFGVIALAAIIGFSFAACGDDDGGGGSVKDNWYKWVDSTATVTLDYSVADDGVCTITVGGTAQPNDASDNWGKWKALAGYSYTAQAGKSYTYKFEAWTQSGTRSLGVQYYADNADSVYKESPISITSTRTTYTVNGDSLPKGEKRGVEFHCADQLGTFYVKVLEIKEVGSSSGGGKGILTVTGLSQYNGKFAYAYGSADDKSGKRLHFHGAAAFYDITDGPLEDTYYTPIAISGGKVEIPLYRHVKFNEYKAYDGNDVLHELDVCINNDDYPVLQRGGNRIIWKEFKSGTFVNGSLTVRWEDGRD